jgi:hypothetical protein
MKTLLSFGDSWPSGMELNWDIGETSFPYLYTKKHGINLRAYNKSGTGIPHLILQLEQAIEEGVDNCIALFCLSSTTRSIRYQDGKWLEINVRNLDVQSTAYFKYIHTKEYEDFMANCYILALQKMCQQYNIEDYYVSCWSKLNLYLPGIDKSRFFNEGQSSLADALGCRKKDGFDQDIDLDSNHPTIYPNQSHPNFYGHQIITDHLSKWITL